jgi:hypothetical protein
MADTYKYDHYKTVPDPAEKINRFRYNLMNVSAARFVPRLGAH